ncbi:MAG TPA: photosynthetic reaction center cytochrome c subunit family protein [Bacteroidota bacterium]|nr:photosynthetic reaction center cytochrome c subunit family protein [Bacteroidota bacterium]
MSKTVQLRHAIILIVTLLLPGATFSQDPPREQRREPPPPRQFPKPDSALIQQMFEKLSKAIEGKADSPAASVFQNIQLFKKLPAGRLLGMMRAWTRNLGVDCSHCHVLDQWEKDDKLPKQTARAMDKMEDQVTDLVKSIKTIKDERARVTCWTCHRGQPVPETNPFRGEFRPPPRKGN